MTRWSGAESRQGQHHADHTGYMAITEAAKLGGGDNVVEVTLGLGKEWGANAFDGWMTYMARETKWAGFDPSCLLG